MDRARHLSQKPRRGLRRRVKQVLTLGKRNGRYRLAKCSQHGVPICRKDLHSWSSRYCFLFAYSSDLCGIATAAHVVAHAHWWEQPIRLLHPTSGKTATLHHGERGIVPDEELDTTAIVVPRTLLPFPAEPLPLVPEGKFLRVGNELGWLGFPAVSPTNLCFFMGTTSCWVERDQVYLVDGVAIHGVSGGPAFFLAGTAANGRRRGLRLSG